MLGSLRVGDSAQQFFAPELRAGTVTPAADIYALGAFLDVMLKGGSDQSAASQQIVQKAMNQSVEARFSAPSQFFAAVEGLA